ncbi:replicative DNA helicase [Ferroacidibacillus organovorans]|uniref:Replicative DNA helicase n=1 Tax=Ferroacidibacillus organovorans TaxID=1765683 RepID=A0A161QFL2_9BACL|nr:replicative DNA helicase [Ferroacidibacillus organovorans]KYP80760.1 replicative DNA helicase [Ferroacidibacillus organovorans]OAG93542.1 replicative DNA helicase [Ferroacidibacillus organovorans]OPG16795.1 replicative DNA helicase [Ferroacidibacillus organovorans]
MELEAIAERIPPQSVEAEQAVLGALLIAPDILPSLAEKLRAEDFYRGSHQILFDIALAIAEKGDPVDLVTLTSRLQEVGKLEESGGLEYLLALSRSVPTAANAEFHAQIVADRALLRRLIQVSTQIAASGYAGGEDVGALLDTAERRILALASERTDRGFTAIREVLENAYERIEFLYNNRGGMTGVPSGYGDLDRMTSGFQPSDLIIIAARPSVGKTAFALNIAQNVAVRAKLPVAIFSLEMSKEQLVQRMICAESNIDANVLRTGQLADDDWAKLSLGMSSLSESPIFIDDSAGVTLAEMRSRLRRLKAESGLGLVVIDYLQLISGKGRSDNRQQEISEISRSLKQLARELSVPMIALSQLSRSVEQRQDKRPMLSDIRESGSIEQDADVVAFLYRDDYYDPESEKKNIVEVIIGKQRNGPTGKVDLVFLKNYNKFVSLERDVR